MHIVIFITVPNKKEANKIAKHLIENRLAACVNIIDKVESVFRWEGKVQRAGELLLVIKSKKLKLTSIIKLVKSMHSYEVPEIIAIPLIAGYKPYLDWLDESVGESR